MSGPVGPRRAAALAAEALVVTCPLVLMDLTRAQLTATTRPGPVRAPVNRFAHMPGFPRAGAAGVVTPNVDTLMSSAWLDLSGEPLVLSLPDTAGRYYAMTLYDAWTTVFGTLGARTTGTHARQAVLVRGPWRHRLPAGMPVIQSPTSLAWIVAHIRSDGSHDHAAVRALQQQIRLTPLSRWRDDGGTPATPAHPAPAVALSPAARVTRMGAEEYFGRVARLLAGNPPRRSDRARVARVAALGVLPGQPPVWSHDDRALVREIRRGMADGLAQVEAAAAELLPADRAWNCPSDLGRRATDPLLRAARAWHGLGSWPRADALFFTTGVDAHGLPLRGEFRYELRFAPGATPPARAFWSLTAHPQDALTSGDHGRRTALGDRDPLVRDADGSLTIHLQADPPLDPHANWLPLPTAGRTFGLVLRLYWPGAPALDGSWWPPPVRRLPEETRATGAALLSRPEPSGGGSTTRPR